MRRNKNLKIQKMGIFKLKRVTFSEEEKDNTKEKKSHPVLSTTAGGLIGFIGGAIADGKINVQPELDVYNSKFNNFLGRNTRNLSKEEINEFIKGKEYKEVKEKLWGEFLKNRRKQMAMACIPTTLIGAGVGYAISRRNKNKEKD